jgi:hypothetical protein
MADQTEDLRQACSPAESRSATEPDGERLAAWHRPSTSVIDIKRTMFFGGSGSDLSGRTTS